MILLNPQLKNHLQEQSKIGKDDGNPDDGEVYRLDDNDDDEKFQEDEDHAVLETKNDTSNRSNHHQPWSLPNEYSIFLNKLITARICHGRSNMWILLSLSVGPFLIGSFFHYCWNQQYHCNQEDNASSIVMTMMMNKYYSIIRGYSVNLSTSTQRSDEI